MKMCGRCMLERELTEFTKDKTRADGLYPVCKICRSLSTAMSKEANKKRSDLWYSENKDRVKTTSKQWRDANKDKKTQMDKAYYEKNKSSISAKQKDYYERTKVFRLKTQKSYYDTNRADFYARVAKRRGRLKEATPSWCDMDKIKEIYRNCPIGHQVDHIVPIQGKNVCGLHVSWNLQYLPTAENLAKGNKYEPEWD